MAKRDSVFDGLRFPKIVRCGKLGYRWMKADGRDDLKKYEGK